jgi:hypothetical protein
MMFGNHPRKNIEKPVAAGLRNDVDDCVDEKHPSKLSPFIITR